MSARISERLTLSIPPCTLNGTARNNGTCADPADPLFRSFSSTIVLLVLLVMITGTVLVSIATFHLHKSRMRKRKIEKAQEEYERDSCRPKSVRGKPSRQCVMERARAVQKCDLNANSSLSKSTSIQGYECTDNTRHTSQGHLLESVAVS
ncbi:uncharacterized protein C11orf87 homolog [Trichomycterus rosablanca]|uniref:uncharacterized protein C11orf87 homolog n=1 Tax=Trichomycterus rosablanca TaxID=2290929 RepID=UPI002F361018